MHDYFLSFVEVVPTTAALERSEPTSYTVGTVGTGLHAVVEPWLRKAVRASSSSCRGSREAELSLRRNPEFERVK